MYRSHPVRRMCEDPLENTETTLIVEIGDRPKDDLIDAVETAGGTVEATLQFGSLRVTVQEEDVEAVCTLDGITAVTTGDTIGIGGDAGEDL